MDIDLDSTDIESLGSMSQKRFMRIVLTLTGLESSTFISFAYPPAADLFQVTFYCFEVTYKPSLQPYHNLFFGVFYFFFSPLDVEWL